MHALSFRRRRIVLILALSFVLSACRSKPVTTPVPVVSVREIVAQGDSDFQRPHLYGWRKAESFYRQAYEHEKTEAIKDKLLLTRFLIRTREIAEDINDPAMESAFAELCASPSSARQKVLCDLASYYKAGIGAKPGERRGMPEPGLFDIENSPLDAFLYTLYLQAYGINESSEATDARSGKFGDSPLFVYFWPSEKILRNSEELEKTHPEFAELFDFLGGAQFQKNRYSQARAYYRKALELIPDYTRSLNGLGNIYLYALEDFEKAQEYYQMSLRWYPGNAAALFGTGRISHALGGYAESNAYLKRMLQSDLSRGGHTSEQAVRYYQGEANYYMAYNFHLMGDPGKAREFVETAKGYLPMSEHVNYLSGLLYYQSRQLRAAKDDFLKVLQGGAANCDAHYYLGRIYRESDEGLDEKPPEQNAGIRIPEKLTEYLKQVPLQKEPKDKQALNHFLSACACMEGNIRGLENQVKSVPSMDLDVTEKVVLQGKLQNKLLGYRRSASSLIDDMVQMASTSDVEKRDEYIILMKEMQDRIGTVGNPATAPAPRPSNSRIP